MSAPGQRLSPAELAALERAFAADPASDAFRPLAEAYLAMGRFMEAMVVSKKGIKTHPSDASARLLLARVHAAQGKDAKALEELQEALKLAPGDVASQRLFGTLQLKAGQREPGTAALRKAWESAPDDAETLAAMKKFGVSFAAAGKAAPTVAPIPGGSRTPAPVPGTLANVPAPAAAGAASAPAPGNPVAPQAAGPAAPTQPAAQRTAADYAEQLASRYATQEHPLRGDAATPRRKRGPLLATVALGVALALALAGWGIASSVRKAKAVEIDRLLRQSRELIEKDSFASYQEAARLCERILQRDHDSLGGHAYLAYIDAIRWGELGEGEALRAEAQKHLDAVHGRPHSHAYAAQAYLTFYGGDPKAALAGLQEVLKGPEGASPLLRGVLGILLMQSGDLDGAREALTFARQNAPGDVRDAQMLAEQWRRRGLGYEAQASALYDSILTRLAPDHVPSLIGKAQLLLDAGEPAEALKRVTRVLQLGPAASPRQIAVAHALRGSVLAALGRSSEGAAEEEQALSIDPTSADVHDLIGRRKLRAGDVAGAVASFHRAIKLDPQRLGFPVDLAHALMRKPDGAREAVAALEGIEQRAGNARITKLLGDAYRSAGELDRARAAYEKALSMEKRYPEALVGIAQLEEARGSPVAVVEKAYATALESDPQSCPALFWLGRAQKDQARLSEYVRLCPKDTHVGEAEQLLGASKLPRKHATRRRR